MSVQATSSPYSSPPPCRDGRKGLTSRSSSTSAITPASLNTIVNSDDSTDQDHKKTIMTTSATESSSGGYFTASSSSSDSNSSSISIAGPFGETQTDAQAQRPKKRPVALDLSTTAKVNSNTTINGLTTPNSASSTSHFPQMILNSSPSSMHLRYKSASMPVNSTINANVNVEIPNVDSISPADFDELMTCSTTEKENEEDQDVEMSEANKTTLPSPPSSLGSSSHRASPVSFESNSLLVVDVRPFAQYCVTRVHGAVNICIPTTLLKRPTFELRKFIESTNQSGTNVSGCDLSDLSIYKNIVLYDNSSEALDGSQAPLLYTVKKFINAKEVVGRIRYLKGGMHKLKDAFPHLIDRDAISNSQSTSSSSSAAAAMAPQFNGSTPAAVSVAGPGPLSLSGFCLPEASIKDGPMKAFASNIRTAMEVYDCERDVAQINLPKTLPSNYKELNMFPQWLIDIIGEAHGSKTVGKKFTDIEMAEKQRLQQAFKNSDSSMTLAGVELGTKNRYNNIWPFDHTRVKVHRQPHSPSCQSPSADYINASRIAIPSSKKRYIATQGPLPATFKDFWKVIYDERIPVIMMLTMEHEGGMLKCDPYWQEGQVGEFNLKVIKQELASLNNNTGTSVLVRHFELSDRLGSRPNHYTIQVQYTDWPDLGSPASASDLLALGRLKDKLMDEWKFRNNCNEELQCLVHCSAGCGRTGTFVTVDSVTDIFANAYQQGTMPLNDVVYEVVHEIRRQRLSMVQNLRQYAMCYEAVIEWCVEWEQSRGKSKVF